MRIYLITDHDKREEYAVRYLSVASEIMGVSRRMIDQGLRTSSVYHKNGKVIKEIDYDEKKRKK